LKTCHYNLLTMMISPSNQFFRLNGLSLVHLAYWLINGVKFKSKLISTLSCCYVSYCPQLVQRLMVKWLLLGLVLWMTATPGEWLYILNTVHGVFIMYLSVREVNLFVNLIHLLCTTVVVHIRDHPCFFYTPNITHTQIKQERLQQRLWKP